MGGSVAGFTETVATTLWPFLRQSTWESLFIWNERIKHSNATVVISAHQLPLNRLRIYFISFPSSNCLTAIHLGGIQSSRQLTSLFCFVDLIFFLNSDKIVIHNNNNKKLDIQAPLEVGTLLALVHKNTVLDTCSFFSEQVIRWSNQARYILEQFIWWLYNRTISLVNVKFFWEFPTLPDNV